MVTHTWEHVEQPIDRTVSAGERDRERERESFARAKRPRAIRSLLVYTELPDTRTRTGRESVRAGPNNRLG